MPPPSASDKIKCTFCGNENEVGSAFCENCGSPLAAPTPSVPAPLPQPPAVPPPPPPATPVSQSVPPAAPSQMIIPTPASQPAPTGHPRIVVVSNGMNFDLSGYQDILIGRVDPTVNHFPQVDLTAHGGDEAGVSRKHLRITFAGNQYFAEDLESSNGSWIGTNRLTPNTRTELNSGDQLRLGKLVLNFYAQ
jgi:pSer/pThr/pTyr-binding forkhead associated (FHA) protein